jgi:hypothetical protein
VHNTHCVLIIICNVIEGKYNTVIRSANKTQHEGADVGEQSCVSLNPTYPFGRIEIDISNVVGNFLVVTLLPFFLGM